MKVNKLYILLGIAAVGGAAWYIRKQSQAAAPMVADGSAVKSIMKDIAVLPTTTSPVKVVNLPPTLIQKSSTAAGIKDLTNKSLPLIQSVRAKLPALSTKLKSMAGTPYALN